jgi:hypothetical protein
MKVIARTAGPVEPCCYNAQESMRPNCIRAASTGVSPNVLRTAALLRIAYLRFHSMCFFSRFWTKDMSTESFLSIGAEEEIKWK